MGKSSGLLVQCVEITLKKPQSNLVIAVDHKNNPTCVYRQGNLKIICGRGRSYFIFHNMKQCFIVAPNIKQQL